MTDEEERKGKEELRRLLKKEHEVEEQGKRIIRAGLGKTTEVIESKGQPIKRYDFPAVRLTVLPKCPNPPGYESVHKDIDWALYYLLTGSEIFAGSVEAEMMNYRMKNLGANPKKNPDLQMTGPKEIIQEDA